MGTRYAFGNIPIGNLSVNVCNADVLPRTNVRWIHPTAHQRRVTRVRSEKSRKLQTNSEHQFGSVSRWTHIVYQRLLNTALPGHSAKGRRFSCIFKPGLSPFRNEFRTSPNGTFTTFEGCCSISDTNTLISVTVEMRCHLA